MNDVEIVREAIRHNDPRGLAEQALERLTINRETEKTLFDIAVNSLDFGSGFLDDEEVEALRRYAVYLGVDPMEATPDDFKPKYCPGHEWHQPWKDEGYKNSTGNQWRCKYCKKTPTTDEWAPQGEVEAEYKAELEAIRQKIYEERHGRISGWGEKPPLPNSSPEPPEAPDRAK